MSMDLESRSSVRMKTMLGLGGGGEGAGGETGEGAPPQATAATAGARAPPALPLIPPLPPGPLAIGESPGPPGNAPRLAHFPAPTQGPTGPESPPVAPSE